MGGVGGGAKLRMSRIRHGASVLENRVGAPINLDSLHSAVPYRTPESESEIHDQNHQSSRQTRSTCSKAGSARFNQVLATALAKTPTTLRDLLLRTGSDATKIACAMSFPSSPMVSEKA